MAEKKRGLENLKEKLTNIALSSVEFRGALKHASEEIAFEAKKAANEATIEGVFERVLYAILREVGIKFHPEKETSLGIIRHTGRGRVDSRIGALVIEYKHRDKLRSQGDISSGKNQLEEYVCSISSDLHNEVIGFLTDGLSLFEVRAFDGKITSWSGEQNINDTSLLNLIRNIVSLEQSALTSENLIRDFCGSSYAGVLFDVARILNSILLKKSTLKTNMLRSEWEELFRLAHDDQSQQKRIQERRAVLSEIFAEELKDASSEYRALFALHSSYAIVLKLIAYRVVSDVQFGSPMQDYKSLIGAESQALRSFCSSLEDGEIFRQLGILNLLEGDFFSWYSDENQWNQTLATALQEILEILGRYEDVSKIFTTVDAIDLFRELYEATVPQVVRASFGEFYTPFWLAQHVLYSSDLKKNWRALDPCCGSGTFIIAAISELRKENKEIEKSELLTQILTRVCAIDLNPLAVLTTRIHYFIHIADLLPEKPKDFVIPVFLGDSSYVPEKVNISGIVCLRYLLRTLKDPISIEMPISLVEDTSNFVQLMYEYEKLVRNQDEKSAAKLIMDALRESER
ncbi:MAG: N-6 DNA methylase, partial [Candidatus Aenigmarchaeota archaeon]|nr:N-6 DNA methylase [Candidatus Aenigmarchaeota archaeon]